MAQDDSFTLDQAITAQKALRSSLNMNGRCSKFPISDGGVMGLRDLKNNNTIRKPLQQAFIAKLRTSY
ncbi:hypothetical protein [Methylobacterium fujisawaense]